MSSRCFTGFSITRDRGGECVTETTAPLGLVWFGAIQRNDNRTGSILAAFHLPLLGFFAPKERVRNHEARLRLGQTQILFLIQQRVEMIVRGIHARILDRCLHVL